MIKGQGQIAGFLNFLQMLFPHIFSLLESCTVDVPKEEIFPVDFPVTLSNLKFKLLVFKNNGVTHYLIDNLIICLMVTKLATLVDYPYCCFWSQGQTTGLYLSIAHLIHVFYEPFA